MNTPIVFDYARAYSRNIGWVTEGEQARLRLARIGVAGLGGVGGAHLLTLCRLGISNFNIADFDDFEVHNINRQAGASMPVSYTHLDVYKRQAPAKRSNLSDKVNASSNKPCCCENLRPARAYHLKITGVICG